MESHYEFIVSKVEGSEKQWPRREHVFATAPRSAINEWQAKKLYATLKAKFPESEGYKVDVTHWKGVGESVDWSNDEQAKLDQIVGR
jgi:hypothetical protein